MPLELLLLIPWINTVVLESAVALIWGLRTPKELGILALINTVTNLTLNLTLSVLHLYVPHRIVVAVMIAMEAAIFVTEGLLVRSLIRRCRHPFLLSFTMNAVSLLAGFLIKI